MKLPQDISDYLAWIGKKGGKAGKGKPKKRGSDQYYSEIAKERWRREKAARKDK